jgi:hypothetical protein
MDHLKRRIVIPGIIFVLITGTLSHFLYAWSGNNDVIGFFTPVNESVWEHMKLLFFPMLIYSIFVSFKFKGAYPCLLSSLCFGILAGTLLIPFFFYAYTSILGKNLFIIDISIFILSTITAFWLSYKLTLSCKLKPYTFLLCDLVCILFICFLVFSGYPPAAPIFEDPTLR